MSKYDCSKTLDYVHEERRLCKSKTKEKDGLRIHDCKDCELNNHPCNLASGKVTQAEIDIVQKWSDEHPEKTRKEAFLELFPKASIYSDALPQTCFAVLIGQEKTMCDGRCCSDCWLGPYAGEFEKAREEE